MSLVGSFQWMPTRSKEFRSPGQLPGHRRPLGVAQGSTGRLERQDCKKIRQESTSSGFGIYEMVRGSAVTNLMPSFRRDFLVESQVWRCELNNSSTWVLLIKISHVVDDLMAILCNCVRSHQRQGIMGTRNPLISHHMSSRRLQLQGSY
jgi:hypothetical protein